MDWSEILPIIIMLLALSVMGVAITLEEWKSWRIVYVFGGGFLAFVLRVIAIPYIPTRILMPDTEFMSAFAYFVYTIVAMIIIIGTKSKGRAISKVTFKWWIIGGYFLFGLAQQALFKFVFFDTLDVLIGDAFFLAPIAVIFLSALYYSMFHASSDFRKLKRTIVEGKVPKEEKGMLKGFPMMTFFIDLGWGMLYYTLGNLHWNALSHAFLGGALFTVVYDDIKNTKKFKSVESTFDKVEEQVGDEVKKLIGAVTIRI